VRCAQIDIYVKEKKRMDSIYIQIWEIGIFSSWVYIDEEWAEEYNRWIEEIKR
jgi:hypothetical protein